MALSPLVQLLVVAVLAYGAGLLLGLSFYRGEIGPGRRTAPLGGAWPATAPPPARDEEAKRRRRRKNRQVQGELGERVRQALVLLFMLGFITILGLSFYSVMQAGAGMLTAPRTSNGGYAAPQSR